ncbi:MAG: hypothetical protein JOY90_37550 [Bradyrhizobium sp.]|uniref:hypothetical protein n=1 Tax=Bradyrhizobium sp. TaxID=376 RepID=UPI001D59F24F|nr:hypothetical protein [Bradyrhizobium sp.]MBV9566115.1 hypothetical protein [Bradyrhizobium sp.]
MTDWFEQGLYLPLSSVANGEGPVLNGFKVRELFVVPHAAAPTFFYGINLEFSYNAVHWDPRRGPSSRRYSDYGAIKQFLPLDQQSRQLFGVVDYKTEDFNIEAGVGFGLTPASDRMVVKLMVSRDLYKPLQKTSESRAQLQGSKPSLGSNAPSAWSPSDLGN